MSDTLVSFALRDAASDELGFALGRCVAEFGAWHGQSVFVAGFAEDAVTSGVKAILADRLQRLIKIGEAEGLIQYVSPKIKSDPQIAHDLADHQLAIAERGVKTAAIVMLHNAFERFLWRLVRFGLVGNREQALKWIERRNVAVETLIADGIDASVDALLEKWWADLERDTILTKWDKLVCLAGFPAQINSAPWNFDRQMLEAFDRVRQNAVHHDAQTVKTFDFNAFANQLWRAQWVWAIQIGRLLGIRIPAASLFTANTS